MARASFSVALNRGRLVATPGRMALLALGGVLLLAAWLYLIFGPLAAQEPQLSGSQLAGQPAPDFRLVDQSGQPLALSDLKGKAVTLSFLYTSCTDICPITAARLAEAYRQLAPDDRERVALLVVTVDPQRDSQQQRAEYAARLGLPDAMRFLGGSASDLSRVWRDFGIGVVTLPASANGGYEVDHTSVTYLIDAQARERALLRDIDFTSQELADSLTALLR